MNIALRNGNGYPSRSGIHPVPPRKTLGRLGASNVNSTTIWTPGGGYVGSGGSTAYVAPTYTAAPACSSGPAATADSAACIAQLLAIQQGNMQLNNNANYNSDVGTCESNLALNNQQRAGLGLPPLPNTCAGNSYGLTPTGGYTSDASVSGPQVIVDQNGNPVNVSAAAQVLAAETGSYVPPVPITPISSPTATPPQQGGTSAASINSGGSAGSSSGSAVVSTPSSTMLYWIGGLAAVALIIAAVK